MVGREDKRSRNFQRESSTYNDTGTVDDRVRLRQLEVDGVISQIARELAIICSLLISSDSLL